jgi:hypothetical protein
MRLFLSILLFLVRLLLAGGAVFFLWKILGPLLPEFDLFYFDRVYHGTWYLAGFVLLAIVFGWIFHRYAVDKLGVFNVAYGALLWWGIALWGVTLSAPHGSYLFVWPLLFSTIVLTISDWKGDSLESSGLALLLISLFSIPGVYLFVQLIYLLYHGMTLMLAGIFAFLVVFVMGTIQLELDFFSRRRPWVVTLALLLLSAGSLIVALSNRKSTSEYPKPDTITYLLDADSGKAKWVTFDPKVDAWTNQFFEGKADSSALRGYFPFNTEPRLVADAPYAILMNPKVELLGSKVSDSVRTTRLRIYSQRDAYEISIVADTAIAVLGAEVNGKPIVNAVKYIPQLERFLPPRRGPWVLDFYGSEFVLELKTKRGERISFTVIEKSSGIPGSVLQKFTPRPDWTIARPFYPTDATIVRKTFRF